MPRSQRIVPALKVGLAGDMHSSPNRPTLRGLRLNHRVKVRDDCGRNSKFLNERPEPMRVAPTDVYEGHISLRKLREVLFRRRGVFRSFGKHFFVGAEVSEVSERAFPPVRGFPKVRKALKRRQGVSRRFGERIFRR